MNLDLNDEAFRGVVAKAIMDQVTPETREDILQQAVRSLLEEKKSMYGRDKTTPLSEAFEHAVRKVAVDVAHETLANDENIRDQIRSLWMDVFNKLFEDETIRRQLVIEMADKFSDALTRFGTKY